MNRNTSTLLGELQKGDRFKYPGKTDAWEVIAQVGKTTDCNQFNPQGDRLHVNDIAKRSSAQVIFLRHTNSQPNE